MLGNCYDDFLDICAGMLQMHACNISAQRYTRRSDRQRHVFTLRSVRERYTIEWYKSRHVIINADSMRLIVFEELLGGVALSRRVVFIAKGRECPLSA